MTQPSTLAGSVAAEVRAQLARRQFTGAALATAINKSEMYVSRRLRGDVAFDLIDLEQIAEFLGLKVAELLPTPERAA
jgi:transcriptional regulator with XRE-family HTH domain